MKVIDCTVILKDGTRIKGETPTSHYCETEFLVLGAEFYNSSGDSTACYLDTTAVAVQKSEIKYIIIPEMRGYLTETLD